MKRILRALFLVFDKLVALIRLLSSWLESAFQIAGCLALFGGVVWIISLAGGLAYDALIPESVQTILKSNAGLIFTWVMFSLIIRDTGGHIAKVEKDAASARLRSESRFSELEQEINNLRLEIWELKAGA